MSCFLKKTLLDVSGFVMIADRRQIVLEIRPDVATKGWPKRLPFL
jgi:hypothetical protein